MKDSETQRAGHEGSAAMPFENQVREYIRRRIRLKHDIDDLAQEVYMRLRNADAASIRKLLPFIYGIARRVVADYKADPAVTASREPIEQLSNELALSVNDAADELSTQQELQIALSLLSPLEAAILILHKRDGHSHEEVAQKLGVSVYTVETYVWRAKAKIRAQLLD
jgi:RNA polymerase sigma factor (sigma-70 family)